MSFLLSITNSSLILFMILKRRIEPLTIEVNDKFLNL